MSCHKVRYGSRSAVHKAQRTNGKRIRAYFCPQCSCWHATSLAWDGPSKLDHAMSPGAAATARDPNQRS